MIAVKALNNLRKPSKPRRPRPARVKSPQAIARRRATLRTALWLLVPPVGLAMMWRSSCHWRPWVKAAISGVMVAAVIAVLAFPTPRTAVDGGVELVTNRPEVEVYGPDLPTFIVPGYTNDQTESVIVNAEQSDVHYVYAADGAECYHEYKCKFAFASSQRLTVYEAYYLGFRPCGRCKPPIYDPVTNTITEQQQDE